MMIIIAVTVTVVMIAMMIFTEFGLHFITNVSLFRALMLMLMLMLLAVLVLVQIVGKVDEKVEGLGLREYLAPGGEIQGTTTTTMSCES